MKIKIIFILILCTTILNKNSIVYGQRTGGGEANPNLHTNAKALAHFQDNKFGMFLHWGPISLRGTEIGWSRGKIVPISDYDNLYKEFNPVLFNADTWIKTAKDAGMKYFIITTKHHDGFCLWDSKFTDYDIMSTPYKKDIVKALAVACNKYGVDFGVYYSIADWHHPDYGTRYGGDPRPLSESDMPKYITYMKNQIKEIIDNYDPFLIWFDGAWEGAYTHEMGMDLYAYLRNLKPDLIINDRVDKGHQGLEIVKMDNLAKYAGDYATPEQRVGAFNITDPWETCMTIATQWAWKPNDVLKPIGESITTLVKTTGGGGNLLYNIGPMPDGRFEQRQTDILLEMGQWLKINGEAIYGTKGGPYLPTDDFVSTRKSKNIYLQILNNDLKELAIPIPKNVKILKIKLLKGNQPINSTIADNHIKFQLTNHDKLPYVIVLETDSNTETLPIVERLNY